MFFSLINVVLNFYLLMRCMVDLIFNVQQVRSSFLLSNPLRFSRNSLTSFPCGQTFFPFFPQDHFLQFLIGMTHWNSSFLSDFECHFSCTRLPLLCIANSLFTISFNISRLRIAFIYKIVSLWFCRIFNFEFLVCISFFFFFLSLRFRNAHLFCVCLFWKQLIELLKRIVEFICLEGFCLMYLNNIFKRFSWLVGRHKFYFD